MQVPRNISRGPTTDLPLYANCTICSKAIIARIREAWAVGDLPGCDVCQVLVGPEMTYIGCDHSSMSS